MTVSASECLITVHKLFSDRSQPGIPYFTFISSLPISLIPLPCLKKTSMLSVCLSVLSSSFFFSPVTLLSGAMPLSQSLKQPINSSYYPSYFIYLFIPPPTRIYYILDTIDNSSRQERKVPYMAAFSLRSSAFRRASQYASVDGWREGGSMEGVCGTLQLSVSAVADRLVENTTMPVSFHRRRH